MALDLPDMGLGTSGMADRETTWQSTARALDIGYRHIDTAQMYDNEEHVGEGIRESGVPRDEIVLATKIHPRNLAYDDAKESARESLERLDVDTVDLLYVHWPMGTYDPEETLRAMDELREEGLTRHVGLSNFTPAMLDEAREILDSPVVAHQVECHPLLQQGQLRRYARQHDHHLVAYCPLGRAQVSHPVLEDVADKHDVSVPIVCLLWCLAQESVVPIPKATGDHILENWEARDMALDDEDLERIDGIDETQRVVDPDGAPWS